MATWTITRPTSMTPKAIIGNHRTDEQFKAESAPKLRKLVVSDIKGVQALCIDPRATPESYRKSRPVFLVTFKDNTTLIIKGESSGQRGQQGESMVFWEAKMMHQVSPQVKINIMSREELCLLRDLPEVTFAHRPMGTRVTPTSASLVKTFITDMVNSGRFVFYKMPYLQGIFDGDIINKGEGKAKRLYNALSRAAALRSLGRIIAADLFNGNNDRFDPINGNLCNPGNLIFHKMEDGNTEPVGLDFYDPMGEDSNLNMDLSPTWGGYFLRTTDSRDRYARMVVANLNRIFEPFGVGLSDTQTWQIRLGMDEGCELMKDFLNRRIMGKRINQGVLKRARALGWGL